MIKRLPHSLRIAAVFGSALVLAGCGSGRAGELEEKLARAEQAATRAELAQKNAEKAAEKAIAFSSRGGASQTEEDPPSPAERDMDKASQDPNSAFFDNNVDGPGG